MSRSSCPRRPPDVGGGLDAAHALLPALLAVAPVMWASQDAKLPRTHAESGPMALGSLCSVATGCRASRSVKRSDVRLPTGMTSAAWRVAPLLFLSGLCALVYQIAWLREFRLIFGASTAASAAVVAIFIGGLGLG